MTTFLRRVRRSGDQSGFTLIELLVVIVLMGVIGAMFTSGMLSAFRTDRNTRARVNVQGDLAKGVDRMTKQIRVAYPVVSFSASSLAVEAYRGGFRWRYTYTYDSAAKTVAEQVQKYASSTAVSPLSTTTTTLLTNVTNGSTDPMFVYYDRNGAVATTVSKVAKVQITLVETPSQQQPIRFTTSVFLRNYREIS
jgi:prepilin-type N-terminal cleavage/methylation domain-containing protein